MRMQLMHCIEKRNQINSQLMHYIEWWDYIIIKLQNDKIITKKVNEPLNAVYTKFGTQNSATLEHKLCSMSNFSNSTRK